MLSYLTWVWFLVPGFLVPPGRGETFGGWVGARVLVSIGANGVVLGAQRLVGVYGRAALGVWLVACLGGLIWVLVREARRSAGAGPRPGPWEWGSVAVAGTAAGVAGYWSAYFPPELWDSTFYHLPLAEMIASDRLFEIYWADAGRHGMLLRGASGGNVYPAFLSGFFALDSPVYRAAPPLVGFAFLALAGDLAARVGKFPAAGVVAPLFLVSAPLVVFLMSDYYVDLLLAALLAAALSYALAVCRRDTTSASRGLVLLSVGAAGTAALVKQSGILVAAVPSLVGGVSYLRAWSAPASVRARNARRLARYGTAALAVGGVYQLWRLTLPAYPAFPGRPELAVFWNKLTGVGLPMLWASDGQEAFGSHIVATILVAAGLWALRVLRCRPAARWLVVGAGLWCVVTVVGIYAYNRLRWLTWWTRYLLPALVLLGAWLGALLTDPWAKEDGGATRGGRGSVWVRRGRRAATAGVVAVFLWLTPWTQLRRAALARFGEASAKPTATQTLKWEAVAGVNYRAWRQARRLAEASGGTIVSADERIWVMMGVVYDTWSLPRGADTVPEVARWLRDHEVTVLVDTRETSEPFGTSDARRGTALGAFVQTAAVERVAATGQHRIYRVTWESAGGVGDGKAPGKNGENSGSGEWAVGSKNDRAWIPGRLRFPWPSVWPGNRRSARRP